MKFIKMNLRYILAIILTLTFIYFFMSTSTINCATNLDSNAINGVQQNDLAQLLSSDPTMTVGLYTDPECTQLDQELNEETILTNNWEVNTSRYVKVELSNLSSADTYKVTIDLDKYLYANIKSVPSDVTFSEIKFTRNDPIEVNVGKTYKLEEFSGVFEYTTKLGYTSLSIVLEIRYDNVLWNKFANMNLKADVGDLLKVSLEDASETELSCKTLTQITTGKALDYNVRVTTNIDNNSDNITGNTIYANSENTIKFKLASSTMDVPMINCYYEQFLVEFDVPKSGDYLMEFDPASLVVNSSYGKADYVLTHDTENNKISILFNNLFLTSKNILNISFSFPEDMLTTTGEFIYTTNLRITLPGAGNNGGDVVVNKDSFKIIMENKKMPVLSYYSTTGTTDYRNKNAVQIVGGYGLANTGSDSGPLTIYMSFNDRTQNNARANVTTFRLNPDTVSDYFKITYTMEDKEGNPIWFDSSGNVVEEGTEGATREFDYFLKNSYYNGTLIKSSSIKFYRDMLIEQHREYYFSSIKYTIKCLPENTTLWHTSAAKSYSSSTGTFWGYIVGDKTSDIYHTIRVYDENGLIIPHLTKEIRTNLTIVESVSFGIKSAAVSKEQITAGDSLKVSGEAFVIDYPYSANNVLNIEGYNMRIGVSLPKGASINTDSIEIKFKNNTLLDIVSVTNKEQTDGTVFWIIEMKAVEGQELGYVSETLGVLPNGNSVKFSFEINTERTTAGTNIILRENLFFAAYQIVNAAGGSYSINTGPDKYDLNSNGRINDMVGIMSTGEISFQVTALSANLSINDSLRTEDNSQTGKEIIINDYTDSIIYDLSIVCESGGRAEDFVYFIPITNNNNITGELIKDNSVSFIMSEAAVVKNSIVGNGVKIYYTNVTNLDYETALASSEDIWFVDLPTGVSWADITMIKVVSYDDFISNGSESVISLKLKYKKTEEEYISEVGMESTWCSRGYYNYSLGNRVISGHFSTEENTVSIEYTLPVKEITLTAAKDRNPSVGKISGIINDIPLFKNAQNYSITNITTHNVNLLSPSYFDTYGSMMSEDSANSSFGFTVSVNSNAASDINQTLPLTIGSVLGDKLTNLEFTIYNADVFSDITTQRYIEITIKGDKGITIPIKIKIERELTEVLASEMGITSGKQYRPFSSTQKSVVISSDSSLTAQFVGELLPTNYKARNITFSESLKAGTNIVMVDWTDSVSIEYYYYKVNSEIKVIDLTSFVKMGTNNVYYKNPTGSTIINENLMFIIDFADANSIFSNSITLNRILQDDSVNVNSMDFETIKQREFALSTNTPNVLIEEEVSLYYSVSELSVSDSKFNGNKMSLVISASQDSYVPADAYIKHDGKTYYANGNGEFIIPLGDTQADGSYNLTFSFYSTTVLNNNGTVKLSACIWSSTNNLKPFAGIKLTTDQVITVSTKAETAFNVARITNRFLTKEDLKQPITLSYITNGLTRLTIEIHQKISNGFTLISTGINSIDGDTTHSGGVFDISAQNASITIKFNEMLEVGSYRLVFRLYDETKQEVENVSFGIVIVE